MNNRSSMFYVGLQTDKYQRQYHKSYSADGTMEAKINNATNEVEFITYIGGDAYAAPIVLKSDGTTQNYLYLHRDYQGSIVAITNQAGQVVEKRLYDAWGEVLKVQDGQGTVLNGFKILDRGYTGHEHLHSVGLIHMNGRLYDPKLHRFLQPDNYIQDPYNTQNYNRYGYVLNNPLKYTDPSGEEITLLASVLIGAAIAATTYTIQASYTYGFQASGWGFLKATFIGAASAAATYGIGTYAHTMPLADKIVFQVFAHGTSQAFFTGIQGGDPLVGFASGALSSAASSAWSVGAGKFAESGVGMVAFGTVMGGAGASLTGGNFWQGAATGLVVSGLNHFAHIIKKNQFENEIDNAYGNKADASARGTTTEGLYEMKNKIPTLKRIFNRIIKNYKDYSMSVSGAETNSDGKSIAITQVTMGINNDPSSVFYQASMSSYRNLARTMLHEFGHGMSMSIGFYKANQAKFKSSSIARSIDEVYAFKFANFHGGVPYLLDPHYTSSYEIYKKYQSQIVFPNF